jgi:preprotein translocase subunit SecB
MPAVNLECKLGAHGPNAVEVFCDYTFVANSDQTPAIESAISYLLLYEISGGASSNIDDLTEFARANGALHSWPFVRELLFGLTSRMGYPPYTLPVMHFNTTTTPPKDQSGENLDVSQRETG